MKLTEFYFKKSGGNNKVYCRRSFLKVRIYSFTSTVMALLFVLPKSLISSQ